MIMAFFAKMLAVRAIKDKVLYSIVRGNVVLVVNNFTHAQLAAKMAFHHQDVLQNVSVSARAMMFGIPHHHISLPRLNVATTFPIRIILSALTSLEVDSTAQRRTKRSRRIRPLRRVAKLRTTTNHTLLLDLRHATIMGQAYHGVNCAAK